MKLSWSLLALLLALFVGGCAADGDTPDGAEGRFGLVSPTQARELGYSTAWIGGYSNDANQDVTSITWQDNMILIVQEPSNLITALASRDGHRVWNQFVGPRSAQVYEPIHYDEYVYANTESNLYRLGADRGEVQEYASLEQSVTTSGERYSESIIFGGASGRIFSHSLVRNSANWVYDMSSGVSVPPAVFGDFVFASDSRGIYVLLNASDGDLLWHNRAFGPIAAQAVANNSLIFVPSRDHKVYAINISDGRDRWTYLGLGPLREKLALAGDTLFVQSPGEGTIGLDAGTGNKLFMLEEMVEVVTYSERGVVVYYDNTVAVLNASTGATLASIEVPRLREVVAGPEGELLVVSENGGLVRLDPRR